MAAVGNPAAEVSRMLLDLEHPQIAAEVHHHTPAHTAVLRAHQPAGFSRPEDRARQGHRGQWKTRNSGNHQARSRRSADELTSIHGRPTFVLLHAIGSMEVC